MNVRPATEHDAGVPVEERRDRRAVAGNGRWSTGAGLTAAECTALVRRLGRSARVRPLTDAALWGKTVTDERYLLVDSWS